MGGKNIIFSELDTVSEAMIDVTLGSQMQNDINFMDC
jgi:hypothetical protein